MGCKTLFGKAKAYFCIIGLQFGYAIMVILSSICLKNGMNHFVLSVYRNVFATIAISPFALIFERKTRPKMTRSIFLKILVLAFLEPVLDSNMYFLGLKYTTGPYASAINNALPAISFIMASIFRLEKVDIRRAGSQAKILGTIATLSGALLMTLYRGPVVNLFGHQNNAITTTTSTASISQHDWIIGTLILLGACTCWSLFFILQSFTLKEYPVELSLTACVCFMGALEGAVVSFSVLRDIKAWALGWDSRLLASVYAGVVCSGLAYYVQGVVNKERGPVFVTMFNPLALIIVTILSYVILHQLIHLGSIIGAVFIVSGLYTVIWGKRKDQRALKASTNEKAEAQELPIAIQTNTSIAASPSTENDKKIIDVL